jgi:type IV secretion system protein VirB2
MNQTATHSQDSKAPRSRRLVVQAAACAGALAASPAFAQIARVNTVMQNVQTMLVGVSVIAFTVALIWAGFKMAFQHAKWSEISNIVIGGIIVGGAAGIAAWLLT